MGVTTSYTVLLFGSIDKVEIHRKCTYYVDSSIQVAGIYNAGNVLIEGVDLVLKLDNFCPRGMGKVFSAAAETFALTAQLLYRFKDGTATISLYCLSQGISQHANIRVEGCVFFAAIFLFWHEMVLMVANLQFLALKACESICWRAVGPFLFRASLQVWVHKRTAYPALHHWLVVIKQRVKGS